MEIGGEYLQYYDHKYKFSIETPIKYHVKEHTYIDPIITILDSEIQDGTQSESTVSFRDLTDESIESIDELEQLLDKDFEEQGEDNVKVMRKERKIINGKEAIQILYTNREHTLNTVIVFLLTCIKVGNGVYSIKSYCMDDAYNEDTSKLWNSLHNSFKIY